MTIINEENRDLMLEVLDVFAIAKLCHDYGFTVGSLNQHSTSSFRMFQTVLYELENRFSFFSLIENSEDDVVFECAFELEEDLLHYIKDEIGDVFETDRTFMFEINYQFDGNKMTVRSEYWIVFYHTFQAMYELFIDVEKKVMT